MVWKAANRGGKLENTPMVGSGVHGAIDLFDYLIMRTC